MARRDTLTTSGTLEKSNQFNSKQLRIFTGNQKNSAENKELSLLSGYGGVQNEQEVQVRM